MASILLVAVVFGGVWKLGLLDELSGTEGAGADRGGRSFAGNGPEVTEPVGEDDGDSVSLEMGDFDPGDCLFYRDDVVGTANTHLVECTEDHRVQLTGEVDLDFEAREYPAETEWRAAVADKCDPMAEEFLGYPLDPHGRFTASAIHPSPESWDNGDRETMWCSIEWNGPLDGTVADDSVSLVFAEDVRGADQAYHHPAGTCLLATDTELEIVDCTETHTQEITGELDLSGRDERPVGAQERALGNDCHAKAIEYLGAEPAAPWGSGWEGLSEESWAAGSRSLHCFVGQWDASEQLTEITAPAKG